MNRIDRLQAILTHLQSKKVVTAQEIADRFSISLRTVYRDIRALEEGGIPIGAEAGLGYYIDDSYSLPPIMFTSEEASAILIAGKIIPHTSDKTIDHAFQNALYKIKSVMKSEDKEVLEKLESSVKVFNGPYEIPQRDSIYLQDIQQALVKSKVLQLEYFAHYTQEHSLREVEPIGLLFYALNWHLIAYCRLREDYRDFRLDRIRNLEVSNETYNRKLDKAFDEYLAREREQYQSFEVELRIEKKMALYIHESKYWYGYLGETEDGNFVNMKFLNPDLNGFARWILCMLDSVEVISPVILRNQLVEMVQKLNSKYLDK
ncbi:helix-turn-helix transcriptional regulator [Marinifilum caeruleilacunae]|uniref:YafY family transcriptional regulator n=1 Tax=Marinifilum caeruleilacunae TaxID=2499076 RepID=A0ABX1WQI6_9BACT|nr:YafY family protein [Marinifilum caeruleilacunae]NOU58345.1 YafY family transcriptional regulator [Marinifilum caeruleilacunae]